MRIALVTGQLTLGGSEKQLTLLARELKKRNHQPIVYCLSENTEPYGHVLREYSVPVRTAKRFSHFDPTRAITVHRWIKTDQVDVLHCWLFHDAIYAGLGNLINKIPCVTSIRVSPYNLSPLFKLATRWALSKSQCIVCNNPGLINYAHNYLQLSSCPIIHIPNGLEMKPHNNYNPTQSETQTVKLVSAGRLEPVKNFVWLLEAISHLVERGIDLSLTIFGEGSQRKLLEETIYRLNLDRHVFLPGICDELAKPLRGSDLFVLTSLHEGTPNVVLEAMAVGTPPVVTATSGCQSVIHHGENGWIIDAPSPAEFASHLEEVINQRSSFEMVGQRAQIDVSQNFSVQSMVDAYINCYRMVMGNDA